MASKASTTRSNIPRVTSFWFPGVKRRRGRNGYGPGGLALADAERARHERRDSVGIDLGRELHRIDVPAGLQPLLRELDHRLPASLYGRAGRGDRRRGLRERGREGGALRRR